MSHTKDVPASVRQSALSIRTAGPGDYAAIREVVLDAYVPFVDALPTTVFARYLADLVDMERHASLGRLLVAEVDGRIRGSAAFYPDAVLQGVGWPAGWAGGRGLAVHSEARGTGVARALLAVCEGLARSVGAPVFAFHTATFMAGALAVYERLGYRRAPEFDLDLHVYFGMTDVETPKAIAYRRDLIFAAACATQSPSSTTNPPDRNSEHDSDSHHPSTPSRSADSNRKPHRDDSGLP